MLSSVLNSDRAIDVNIQIMRTFAKIRELMMTHKDLRQKIEEMEKKYDYQFKVVFEAIKKLLEPPQKSDRVPSPADAATTIAAGRDQGGRFLPTGKNLRRKPGYLVTALETLKQIRDNTNAKNRTLYRTQRLLPRHFKVG